MKKQKLYFAHPVNTYNTPIETEMLQLISETFPELIIENPNQPHHQEGYKKWKEKYGNGMKYFYEEVMENCEAGTVALPFLDDKLGAGVARECVFSIKRRREVYVIKPSLKIIRPFTAAEKILLLNWDVKTNQAKSKKAFEEIGNKLVLSIKETRLRTWLKLYKVFRPYEEAHLV